MKVLLLEAVESLGAAGDIVDVSEGYARNFLFPRGVAAQASEGRVAEVERKKKKKEEAEQLVLDEAQKLVDILDGKTISMKLKIGPEGKTFGAITAKDIINELEKSLGINLPKSVVKLREPIKQIGEKNIRIEFPHGLEADLIVVVEADREEKPEETES